MQVQLTSTQHQQGRPHKPTAAYECMDRNTHVPHGILQKYSNMHTGGVGNKWGVGKNFRTFCYKPNLNHPKGYQEPLNVVYLGYSVVELFFIFHIFYYILD